MKGHFYKPHCKCTTKKCKCSANWAYIIDVGINPATGKRKQKKKGGFATKAEAEIHAAQLLIELKQGTYVEEKDITFGDFADMWIKLYEGSGKVKVSTVKKRKRDVIRLVQHLNFYKIKDITRDIYQELIFTFNEFGYKHNTLTGINQTAKLIFKKAIELGVIKNNPTDFSYIPTTQKSVEELEALEDVPKYLEKEELKLFLETSEFQGLEGDHITFTVLSYTGMRVGEWSALKWPDIDFENHEISITKTLYRPNNKITEYTLLTPKTTTSRRKITVPPEVMELLLAHKKRQNEIKMKFRNTYHDKDFVMAQTINHPGYPLAGGRIGNRMSRLLQLCKLGDNLTPHSLRHTHTSLLAEAGAELHEIMDRLGHSDDKTTRSIYLHVTQTRKKDTSAKFSELMKSLK
ncbi:tyrosine-type recombinase/integrase [Paenibacillus xylanexedens]|uniref:Integrase n=1 Tax=Paenibacillus xylanexedens TaxID=528191 RepID=A0ABS4RLS7_PAEXY|nr:site-specific integrase [Paenibacillus xylanexedens]MBP2243853.1 integrase [Paenibacillus xylanexedens]